jgi:hypothetical protein
VRAHEVVAIDGDLVPLAQLQHTGAAVDAVRHVHEVALRVGTVVTLAVTSGDGGGGGC